MISDIKIVSMGEGVKLHMMKSSKFKTDLVSINMVRPLNDYEAVRNSLITRILERGTEKYPTFTELSNRLDDMYGAILVADATKYGEKHVLEFKVQYPAQKHISGVDLLSDGLDMLKELIFKPVLADGIFKLDFFEQEVKNLRDDILARMNDKAQYALERCLETMCADEPYRVFHYGSVEELDKVTPADLYKHYQNVVATSATDVIVIGNIDFDEVEMRVKACLDGYHPNPVVVPDEIIITNPIEVKTIRENYDVKQGKLSIGYRIGLSYTDPRYEAAAVMSNVLGGGANSLLFKNIREKESLCYYIYSSLEKFKGLMLIGAGVDVDKFDKTLELIEQNLEMMRKGEFEDEDIEIAKKGIISSIDSLSDYPNSFTNYYYSFAIFKKTFDLELFKTKIKSVTKAEIMAAAELVKLDTIFIVDGLNDGGEAQ